MESTSTTSAQRRRHLLRKSRSGCQDCRRRKVKCDEVKPLCSNCRRRYVNIQSCDWSTDDSHNSAHTPNSVAQYQSSGNIAVQDVSVYDKDARVPSLNSHPSSLSSFMTRTSKWRTLELRLMYHYTAVVSHTMPGCNGATVEAWLRTIPQLSFQSEVVLNPMLALSALHLHAHSKNDSNMAIVLRWYLGQSLANHRQALSNPSEEVSEPLWLSAVLLSHIYWLLAHQAQPNEPYELPLQAFMMLEGVGVLFEQKNLPLGRQGYKWIGYEAIPHIAREAKLSIAAKMQLRIIEEDLTYLLDAFDVAEMSDEDKSIYIEAKIYVLHHYRAFFSGTDPRIFQRFIGFMAVKCQPGYRNKLTQHDPLAMALMARMLVLLIGVGHAWWMNGEGDYEVVARNVRGIRGLMPAELRWVMDWPCMVLEKEILLTRDQ